MPTDHQPHNNNDNGKASLRDFITSSQLLHHCPSAHWRAHALPFVCILATARVAHGAPGEPRQKLRPLRSRWDEAQAATAPRARHAATRGSVLPLQRVAAGGQPARSCCFHLTHKRFSELDLFDGGKKRKKRRFCSHFRILEMLPRQKTFLLAAR